MNLPAPHTELAEGPVWDNYTSTPVGVLCEAWNSDRPTCVQCSNQELWCLVWGPDDNSRLYKARITDSKIKLAFRRTADFSTNFHQQVTLYRVTWGRNVELVLGGSKKRPTLNTFSGRFWITYCNLKKPNEYALWFDYQKLLLFNIKPQTCVHVDFYATFKNMSQNSGAPWRLAKCRRYQSIKLLRWTRLRTLVCD